MQSLAAQNTPITLFSTGTLADTPSGSVVIQADRRSKAGLMLQVMDAARVVGVDDVSLAVKRI